MIDEKSSAPERAGRLSDTDQSDRRRSTRIWHQTNLEVRSMSAGGASAVEEGQTYEVNAHGGMMSIRGRFDLGQTIVLANPKTKLERACQVVRVAEDTGDCSKVAFEFCRPSPDFWAIAVPPRDWEKAHEPTVKGL
jgi:hypothetical protein